LEYLEKKEIQERQQRTESSSQLFGLVPRSSRETWAVNHDQGLSGNFPSTSPSGGSVQKGVGRLEKTRLGNTDGQMERFSFDFESTFLGLTDTLPGTPDFSLMGGSLDADAEQTFGALNLFPLLETDGHIDLANYF
jgi:hypothetical protein